MKSALIHLGSGALGLGLVLPKFMLAKGGVDIYLANRSGSSSEFKNEILKSKKYYYLRVTGQGHDIPVKLSEFFYFDEEDKIFEIVCQKKTVFLTTALKEYGINESIDFISELIHTRNYSETEHPFVIIACENAIDSSSIKKLVLQNLKAKYGESYKLNELVVFLDCVVDRICNIPIVDKIENVISWAEDYSSWIIDVTNLSGLKGLKPAVKSILSSIPNVVLVDDIEFYIRRKKWLVNSLHQLIALYTHAASFYRIDEFVSTKRGNLILDELAEEVVDIYLHNEDKADRSNTVKYVTEVKSRFEIHPSNVFTSLTRFTKREKLPDFYSDFYRKVGFPTINYMSDERVPLFHVPFVLLKTTELIALANLVVEVKEDLI